jgi:hypothetical protein
LITKKLYNNQTMKSDNISVEIFRDVDGRDMSIEAAVEGVERIRHVTTGIEIVRATKLLKIVNNGADRVQPNKIRWPKFEADMNIILTERSLFLPRESEPSESSDMYDNHISPLGIALKYGDKKIAVVDTVTPDFPELIAAHEIGHMFNLKKNGATWDSDVHCVSDGCMMYKTAGVVEIEQPIAQRGFRGLIERCGLREPEYSKFIVPSAEKFCDECVHQIDKTSYFIRQSKLGKYIPPEWR